MKNSVIKKMGIWTLAISLFVFHLLFSSHAHAETGSLSWKYINAKNGECRIAFPSVPQMIQQSLPLADGINNLNYDVYLAPHEEKGVFLLLVATYPMNITGNGQELSGLEGLISGIVNHHPDNQLVFADITQLLGHPAMNFLVEGGGSYFRGQAIMSGNKLFLIAMEGRKGEVDEGVYERFLKSFKITP